MCNISGNNPTLSYQEWCKQNGREWLLTEHMSHDVEPHENPLYRSHAIYQSHQYLRKNTIAKKS